MKLAPRLTLGAAYVLGATYQDQARESSVSLFAEPPALPSVQEGRTVSVGTAITDLHLSVYF